MFEKTPLFLAPLAGLSDLPFRGIVKEFGCDITVSEMISANALVYESKKTLDMLQRHDLESPYFVQIEGSDPKIIKKAVEILNSISDIDGIDLNCGCPVPKIIKQNSGSALLKNPKLLCELVEIIKTNSTKKYTSVKLRLGFDSICLDSFAQDIQNAGADFITIHARTRAGGFTSMPNYKAIGEIKSKLKIPVVANGSINEINFKEVLQISEADGVMIGRASIGKPWIFDLIKGKQSPDKNQKKQIILKHFDLVIKRYGQHGCAVFRKHLHEYCKNLKNASLFREKINQINDSNLLKSQIEDFF